MQDLHHILQFFHKIEKLKTIQRQVSVSDNSRKESPAEHTWRVAIMAMILHRKLSLDINLLKALEIILVHDIVEAIADDTWILDKNNINAHNKKKQKELQAAKEIYSILPNGIGEELESLWIEFETGHSDEAKFARALDKVEVIIQRIDLGVHNWERDDIYPILMHWADESVEEIPALKKLWEAVQSELTESYNKR